MNRRMADLRQGFESLPEGNVAEILGGRRALILAPHPDDESLGCGGLIASACATGHCPSVVIMTDGSRSHPGSRTHPPKRLAEVREAEAARAAAHLGLPAPALHFLRYEDTKLPGSGLALDELIGWVAGIGRADHCEMVIGPWHGDPHCDHVAAAQVAADVAEGMGWTLLSYPVWGWLRPDEDIVHEPRKAGWRLDITAQGAAKQRAIAAHASQFGELINDSPKGFRLPPALLAVFRRSFEVFIQ